MDEAHLVSALRYVSLNPVRARLVARAEDWRWSSVRAHLAGKNDGWNSSDTCNNPFTPPINQLHPTLWPVFPESLSPAYRII